MNFELRTIDGKPTNFYVTAKLSENIEILENGFLRANNVIMGRTGPQQYTSRELGVTKGGEKTFIINVNRHEEDVFHEDTLKSIEGKRVTLGHPKDENGNLINVTSKNYDKYGVGYILNVRRDGNNIVGDIIVENEDVINLIVNKDVRELSLGYTSVYELDGDRDLKQTNIIVNHLALVEKGRAGNAMIVDEANQEINERGGLSLKKESFGDKILKIFGIRNIEFEEDFVADADLENKEEEKLEDEQKNYEIKTKDKDTKEAKVEDGVEVKDKYTEDEKKDKDKETVEDKKEVETEDGALSVETNDNNIENNEGEGNIMTLEKALKQIAELEPLKGTEAYDKAIATIDSAMVEAGLGSIIKPVGNDKVEIFDTVKPTTIETNDSVEVKFSSNDFINGVSAIYDEYTPKALDKVSRNTQDRAFRIKQLSSIEERELIKRA